MISSSPVIMGAKMRGSDEQNNLLFRWFVGLRIDDAVQVPTVFSRYRDRLLTTDVARQFLAGQRSPPGFAGEAAKV